MLERSGVKLNRQMVGKKLIVPPGSDNPFNRYVTVAWRRTYELTLRKEKRNCQLKAEVV
jgi:hypothetical protein